MLKFTKNYEGKAACMNAVRSAINDLAPVLIARLAEGYKVKDNGELYKKDKDDLRALIAARDNGKLRIYIEDTKYSIRVEAKGNYLDDPGAEYSSCSYIDEVAYLCHPNSGEICMFEPRDLVTAKELRDAESTYADLEVRIRELETRKSGLRYKYEIAA